MTLLLSTLSIFNLRKTPTVHVTILSLIQMMSKYFYQITIKIYLIVIQFVELLIQLISL